MTPKEKAEYLVKRFYANITDGGTTDEVVEDWKTAKQLALICLQEMIGDFNIVPFKEHSWEYFNSKLDNVYQAQSTPVGISSYSNEYRKFWQQVKIEIEKL